MDKMVFILVRKDSTFARERVALSTLGWFRFVELSLGRSQQIDYITAMDKLNVPQRGWLAAEALSIVQDLPCN